MGMGLFATFGSTHCFSSWSLRSSFHTRKVRIRTTIQQLRNPGIYISTVYNHNIECCTMFGSCVEDPLLQSLHYKSLIMFQIQSSSIGEQIFFIFILCLKIKKHNTTSRYHKNRSIPILKYRYITNLSTLS